MGLAFSVHLLIQISAGVLQEQQVQLLLVLVHQAIIMLAQVVVKHLAPLVTLGLYCALLVLLVIQRLMPLKDAIVIQGTMGQNR